MSSDGAAARLEGAGSRDEILDGLRQYVAEISDGRLAAAEIDPAGHLFDYGYVDSLSAVMLLEHIQVRFGAALDDLDLIERYTSLAAIADRIQQGDQDMRP